MASREDQRCVDAAECEKVVVGGVSDTGPVPATSAGRDGRPNARPAASIRRWPAACGGPRLYSGAPARTRVPCPTTPSFSTVTAPWSTASASWTSCSSTIGLEPIEGALDLVRSRARKLPQASGW